MNKQLTYAWLPSHRWQRWISCTMVFMCFIWNNNVKLKENITGAYLTAVNQTMATLSGAIMSRPCLAQAHPPPTTSLSEPSLWAGFLPILTSYGDFKISFSYCAQILTVSHTHLKRNIFFFPRFGIQQLLEIGFSWITRKIYASIPLARAKIAKVRNFIDFA